MDSEYSYVSALENYAPAITAMLVQAAVSASNSFAWTLLMASSLSQEADAMEMQHNEFGGFPLCELLAVKKPCPENQDGSDTDGEDGEDEEVEEQEEDGDDEENVSGDEAGPEGDPEDDPEANGDAGSEEEDEEEDDEDDDGDDDDNDDGDEEDEEEEEEEEEEEIPEPPAKKRK